MQKTNIGWTDYSLNLLKYRDPDNNIVHACVRVSEGCRNCYASTLAGRWGRKGKDFTAQNMKPLIPFFDEKGARELLRSRKVSGKRVFVSDMTDLFGDWVSDDIIDQHFAVFSLRADVTFQILTKRAKRMRDYFVDPYHMNRVRERVYTLDQQRAIHEAAAAWPLPNVHLGVSVEDPDNKLRLAYLRDTPASVRWVSLEPFLEHMEFDHLIAELDGIVIGGESGAKYRAMPISSALMLARKASDAGVAVYFKQDSGPRPGMQGRIPDDVWAMKEWPRAA